MNNLIKIPMVDGIFEVRFPQKCVYCGKPQEMILPICMLWPALALLFAFLVGNLGVRKIWGTFDKTFAALPAVDVSGGLGLSMLMGGDVVGFSFSNQMIAEEFARMNGLPIEITND